MVWECVESDARMPPGRTEWRAALCKKIGSPAYDTWIEAMITLNDRYEGATPYKAVDLIASAHPRTQIDLCAFIHKNPLYNEKK